MRKLFTLTLVFLISMTWLYGQTKTITGVVMDQQAMKPLSGVTITIQGKTGGSQTDEAGRFSIDATPSDQLIFTYIGYKRQSLVVGEQTALTVNLESDDTSLEEVVVVGYGTTKKADLTGAIGSVKAADIAQQPAMSAVQSIQGKLSGVNITASEAPGSTPQIVIRGLGTALGGRDPLYIVDGFPVENLNNINPADIEAMDVLKDASSASIYGIRAANGVIMVTTKKGRAGTVNINYQGYAGIKNILNKVKMADASQYITYYNENQAGLGSAFRLKTSQANNTDWYDELLQNGTVYNNNVQISGGSEHIDYLFSANNFTEHGILDGSKFVRNTIRNNNTYKFLEGRLKFSQNLNLNFNNATPKPFDAFNSAYRQSPLVAPFYDNGRYGAPLYNENTGEVTYIFGAGQRLGSLNNTGNPLFQVNRQNELLRNIAIQGGLEGEFKITDYLKINSRIGGNKRFGKSRNYTDVLNEYLQGNPNRTEAEFEKLKADNPTSLNYVYNRLNYRNTESFSWIWENFITFQKSFDKHNLEAVAGFSRQKDNIGNFFEATGYDLPNQEQYWNLNFASSDYQKIVLQSLTQERALASYFGRVQYNFDSKYYATATYRYDGTSVFRSTGKYYAGLPSFGLGWTITNEDFLQDHSSINFLKLRANWGKLGNQEIPLNVSQILTSAGSSNYNYVFGSGQDLVFGAAFGSPARNVFWEITREAGVGLDFTLWNNLSGSIDYYNKLNTNVILNVRPTLSSPFSTDFYDHGGKVSNSGVELALNWSKTVSEDLNYKFGVTYGYNKNEVIDVVPSYDRSQGGSLANGEVTKQLREGQSIYSWWLFEADGVWQSAEEIAANPKYGTPRVGHLRYKDQNGDGLIDSRDKKHFGSYLPTSTYGINLGINYKAFDFLLQGYGVAGNKIYNGLKGTRINGGENIAEDIFLDRWTPENKSNVHPGADRDAIASSYYLESGNYFRINNITLGYTFKNLYSSKSNLRLYVMAQNPFIFTKYSGFSPEIASDGRPDLTPGIELSAYPTTRNFLFGLNVQF